MFDVDSIRGSNSSGSAEVHENSDSHEFIFSLMALLVGLAFWIGLILHLRD